MPHIFVCLWPLVTAAFLLGTLSEKALRWFKVMLLQMRVALFLFRLLTAPTYAETNLTPKRCKIAEFRLQTIG